LYARPWVGWFICRLPWKASFVSPAAKVGRIIVVTHYAIVTQADDFGLLYGFSAFEHGLRCYEDRCDLPYTLIAMDCDTYLRSAHEIHLIHKNLAGIIFFRNIGPLLATRSQLKKMAIPSLFYGSDRYRGRLVGENSYCYQDDALISMALEYLVGKGHKRILCTQSDWGSSRYQSYKTWMCEKGLWSEALIPVRLTGGRLALEPGELLRKGTAVLGIRDEDALAVLNAAVRAGIPVPESLAVMGIDNYPLGTHTVVPLTSVNIPIAADAERCLKLFVDVLTGKRRTVQEHSTTNVVIRESA